MNMWVISNFLGYLMIGIISSIMFALFSRQFKNFLYMLRVKNFLSSIKILEITNEQQCQEACLYLKAHCQDLSALGFDCEWVSVRGKRKPVALLQLATVHGLCCLFRLNILGVIHKELEELLNNPNIIKLGVSPMSDSKLLKEDYNVQVLGTLDLRYLYPTGGGLGSMAASEIGVKLDKGLRIKCSNWEAPELKESQKDYAAKDAFVAIEIFKKWLLTNNKVLNLYKRKINYDCLFTQDLKSKVCRHLDLNFKMKPSETSKRKQIVLEGLNQKKVTNNTLTRKSPLYHNCFMHAPDGELLCSCDKRKAQWYVDRGLAEVLPGEPYSIRLLFEPAARPDDGTSKKFYQQLKQNCCVVCGADESYHKHYIVPKEYRKHFPNIMKDHQSHDIVLLCVICHHISSLHNENFRQKLANLCVAPILTPKVTQNKAIQKVKNSAKALLSAGDLIPPERKICLENEVKNYYKTETLTQDLLTEACNLKSDIIDLNCESHGMKVVKYFMEGEGGLTKLEMLWREHFLNTMKPQYMPAFWSVTHKNLRASVKAD